MSQNRVHSPLLFLNKHLYYVHRRQRLPSERNYSWEKKNTILNKAFRWPIQTYENRTKIYTRWQIWKDENISNCSSIPQSNLTFEGPGQWSLKINSTQWFSREQKEREIILNICMHTYKHTVVYLFFSTNKYFQIAH